jgi:hypothetical protein
MARTVEQLDALIDALEQAPWLAPFVEDDDSDVDVIRARFDRAHREYTYRRSVPARMVRAGGVDGPVITTALEDKTSRAER